MNKKKHKKSILQVKGKECYLCRKLYGVDFLHPIIHEHHAFPGNPGRRLSEEHGFKVYLCPEHHIMGKEAVHNNIENLRIIQRDCQREFEKTHTREEFMEIFTRNFLAEEEAAKEQQERCRKDREMPCAAKTQQNEEESTKKRSGLCMDGFYLLEEQDEEDKTF